MTKYIKKIKRPKVNFIEALEDKRYKNYTYASILNTNKKEAFKQALI